MTRAKKITVESFAPELLALLLAGSKERKTVNLPKNEEGEKAAITLRHRLNTLRSAMRKEKHDNVSIVERAKITIENKHIVVIEPHDSQFLEAIHEAGVDLPTLPPAPAGKRRQATSDRNPTDPLDGLVSPPTGAEQNPTPKRE